ncbi:MAG TPA: hypothetical protein VGJ77_09610, partial [Gaiellaceae bacterium]
MLEPFVALAVAASGTLLFAHGGALVTADADGNCAHELPVRGDSPRWSPDGTKILHTRGTSGIYVVDADGTHGRAVVRDRSESVLQTAAWAP